MKIDENIARLIEDLEYKIGKQCYNCNSYNGYTGEQGAGFRYPVYVSDASVPSGERKIYSSIHIQPEQIVTLKYKFGSNHLYIGKGLIEILELLEERYGIDFNELVKNNEK